MAFPAAHGEPVEIEIKLTMDTSDYEKGSTTVKRGTEETKKGLNDMFVEANKGTWGIRMFSRDLMTLGFGLNVIGREFGISGKTFKDFTGALIAIGAIARTALVIKEIAGVMTQLSAATKVATAAQAGLNAQMGATTIISGGGGTSSGGSNALGSILGILGMLAPLISFQQGGTVPKTGPYLLHQGETVVPTGGSSYAWNNITMHTGAISSSVDAEGLLNDIGSRVTMASRRRIGH